MKLKLKYIIFFIIFFIISVISINLVNNDKPKKVKGIVHIWVQDDVYGYINQCANKFMDENNRVTVYVDKINDYDKLKSQLNNTDQVEIFQCSYNDLLKHGLEQYSYYNYGNEIMDMYGSNFSKNTKKKYSSNYKVSSIPFTSRPLALYVKKDILEQYGYSINDFNTWDDVIKIGEHIYSESGNKIKLFKGTGTDYYDLLKIFLLNNIKNEADNNEIKNESLNVITDLKEKNIITKSENEEYLARITSVNAVSDIINEKEKSLWNVGNVPGNGFGENKFFTVDDTALYILENSNNDLADKFIKSILMENDMCIENMKSGKFFLTYLYSYKNKQIEDKINNIEGQSPLIVLSNIELKAEYNEEFDKYLEITKDLP